MKIKKFTTICDRICLALWPVFFTLISVALMFGISFFTFPVPYGDGYPHPSKWEVLESITPIYFAYLIGFFIGGVIFVSIIAAITVMIKKVSFKETFLKVYKWCIRISLPFIAFVSVYLLVVIIYMNL